VSGWSQRRMIAAATRTSARRFTKAAMRAVSTCRYPRDSSISDRTFTQMRLASTTPSRPVVDCDQRTQPELSVGRAEARRYRLESNTRVSTASTASWEAPHEKTNQQQARVHMTMCPGHVAKPNTHLPITKHFADSQQALRLQLRWQAVVRHQLPQHLAAVRVRTARELPGTAERFRTSRMSATTS
jgi:hypothetical protein